MSDLAPTILVIVGITGDLAKRKLLPAIESIARSNNLPEKFQLVGITRRTVSVEEIIDSLPDSKEKGYGFVKNNLKMLQMNLENPADYEGLKKQIERTVKAFGANTQTLFYLSVPPQASEPVIEQLGQSKLGRGNSTKLLLEKPFGFDLTSAQELVKLIDHCFDEEQVYRIDHFLAKEMAQNLVIFRDRNALFRHAWNHEAIDHIDILATEAIGIEGRTVFYEQTGALRDILQSHLLQLLALTIMKLPKELSDQNIQKARLEALTNLQPADPQKSVRGQYEGYTEEVKNTGSLTETFAKVTLYSNDQNWKDVPFNLIAGKALDKKLTDIQIFFKPEGNSEPNKLCLRIQPKEGVELNVWAKQPGYERKVEQAEMSFAYGKDSKVLPDAYEQVLIDAIRSDKTLFATSKEILEAWRVLEPVQQSWQQNVPRLVIYERGSLPDQVIKSK